LTRASLLTALAVLLAASPARAQDTIPPAPRDTVGRDTLPPSVLVDSALMVDTASTGLVPPRVAAPPAPPRRRVMPRPRPRVNAARPPARPRARAPRVAGGARVCAGGDVTLGTNLDTTWVFTAAGRLGRRVPALPSPDSLLAPLRPLVWDADILLLNVEGAIGSGPPGRRKCEPNSNTCFAFRSEPAAAAALRRLAGSAAFIGNVANNHARDAGDGGWQATVRHLRAAGGQVSGFDTLATPIATAAGDTVAFLGFSPWAGPDPRNLAAVRRHVSRAAQRWGAVAVAVHIGAEGRGAQHTANRTELFLGEDRGNPVAFAHAAVEAGASVVFGSGPHVMRAAEWYRGGLIFYSLGNLLTYGPFTLAEPLNRGALACVTLQRGGGIAAAELRSTRQLPPGLVRADSTGLAAALVDALGLEDFPGTAARVAMDGWLPVP
jgi:hypothetical protein